MSKNVNNAGDEPVSARQNATRVSILEILRTMVLTTVLAVAFSLFFSSWQVTSGLLIGGLLALLNHRWLQTSIAAAFGVLLNGETPRITLGKYIFRYFVVGSVVFAAYEFGTRVVAGDHRGPLHICRGVVC